MSDSISSYWKVGSGLKPGDRCTDIAFLRIPSTYPSSALDNVSEQLAVFGFQTVFAEHQGIGCTPEADDSHVFFTDYFKQIGNILTVASRYFYDEAEVFMNTVLHRLEKPYSVLDFRLAGGGFVFNSQKRRVFFDTTFYHELLDGSKKIAKEGLFALGVHGYVVTALDNVKTLLRDDLDFHVSFFTGKDQKLHALVSQSFLDGWGTSLKGMKTHVIPDREIKAGGANIADLQNGRVLLAPNRKDAPTGFNFLIHYLEVPSVSTEQRRRVRIMFPLSFVFPLLLVRLVS